MRERTRGRTQALSSARAGISERSGRRLEKGQVGHLMEAPARRREYRTRKDPFEAVWKKEVVPLLEENPGLQAKSLLDHLAQQHPGEYPESFLRTLQRKIRRWRVLEGEHKRPRIFPQEHYPGRMGICDFTDMSTLGVTIAGRPFPHRAFHFRLTYSGWEWAEVVLGGESFPAFAEHLERSLDALGGVPEICRTDSLSAAYRNLSKVEQEDFTKSFEALMSHYGMQPTRNNRGVAHENGAIESPHGHMKRMADQALMLRNSRDFESEQAYRLWLRELIRKANMRRQARLEVELKVLRPLPPGRAQTWKAVTVKVNTHGIITVDKVLYVVEENLIGLTLRVRLFDDRLECYYGQDLVATLPRRRRTRADGERHIYAVHYRHVIERLVRKPGAFPGLTYRDAVHPTDSFRAAWTALSGLLDPRHASKEYLGMLLIAHRRVCEDEMERRLRAVLDCGQVPRLADIAAEFDAKTPAPPPVSTPVFHDEPLSAYDTLCGFTPSTLSSGGPLHAEKEAIPAQATRQRPT